MRQFALVITASAIGATAIGAQRPFVLAKPDVEFAEPFSLIAGVRELKDGRVLVSDAKEKTLQIITFGGSAQRVSRQGAGPGEYATPSRTVALPGDTSAVYDAANTRYLTILPDGRVGKDFRLEVTGSGGIGWSRDQARQLAVADVGGVSARRSSAPLSYAAA